MKYKTNMTKIQKGYIKVPIEILKLNLTSQALAIFVFMLDCDESFNPSVRFISKQLNISINTIRKAIRELLSCKVITIEDQYIIGKKVRAYAFNNPKLYKMKVKDNEDESKS